MTPPSGATEAAARSPRRGAPRLAAPVEGLREVIGMFVSPLLAAGMLHFLFEGKVTHFEDIGLGEGTVAVFARFRGRPDPLPRHDRRRELPRGLRAPRRESGRALARKLAAARRESVRRWPADGVGPTLRGLAWPRR